MPVTQEDTGLRREEAWRALHALAEDIVLRLQPEEPPPGGVVPERLQVLVNPLPLLHIVRGAAKIELLVNFVNLRAGRADVRRRAGARPGEGELVGINGGARPLG